MNESLSADERAERLAEDVKKNLKPGLDDKVQEELAELLGLLPYLRSVQYSHLLAEAEVVLNALLLEPPNLTLATELRRSLSYQVRPARNPLLAAFGRGATSPPTRVILGLGWLLYFAMPGLLLSKTWLSNEFLGLPSDLLAIAALAGALGSIVSIMVRIQDFSDLHEVDPAVLLFTGFFKPVIGASFALFVLACLKSGIIPITVQPVSEQYFLVALSFVAGFSERFAKDIASSVERSVPSGLAPPPAPGRHSPIPER